MRVVDIEKFNNQQMTEWIDWGIDIGRLSILKKIKTSNMRSSSYKFVKLIEQNIKIFLQQNCDYI